MPTTTEGAQGSGEAVMPGLAGRAVIVTGAGSADGIGAAYAVAFASAGAHVLVTDRPELAVAGRDLAAKITAAGAGRVVYLPADVTVPADWEQVVQTAQTEFGGVHALVNNAAAYRSLERKQSLLEVSLQAWLATMQVNAGGPWLGIQAVVPAMIGHGGGRIVNVSSVVARTGTTGFPHYVMSKAAVDGLTRAAAAEFGRHGVLVNGVAPGLVTDAATRELNDAGYVAAAARSRALGRELTPVDLVGPVLWLCSELNTCVTGQTIIADGGGVFC